MTGYGKATGSLGPKQLSVEIRSLNSKFLDLHLKTPSSLREREIDLRNIAQEKLMRGKVELSISLAEADNPGNFHVNIPLVRQYYSEVKKIETELNLPEVDLLSTLLQLPNVVEPIESPITEEVWAAIMEVLNEAILQFNQFRSSEGQKLEEDLSFRVNEISDLAGKVKAADKGRVDKIRERIAGNLDNLVGKEKVDQNRLEQEIVYYLEKLDITEELVRLNAHCTHFNDSLAEEGAQKGKKLGFISQEMGREINTLGSKANDADIQRQVVLMKEHLEKVKEQILNIL